MFAYAQDTSWVLDRVWFEYLGGGYQGRGLLRWNPERGFHLDAFLERHGAPLPSKIEFGKLRFASSSESRSIRMCPEGFDRAISPRLVLGDRLELIHATRLDVDFPSVLFSRRLPHRQRAARHCGSALLEVGKGLAFPDLVERELQLNARPVETQMSTGIAYQDESLTLRAWPASDTRMRMDWALSPETWSRADAWNYAEGAQAALSFLSGRTVRLLERTTRRGAREYIERRKQPDLVQLGLLSLPPRGTRHPNRIDKATFVQLARFFTQGRDSKQVLVCRRIIAQMAEARQQQTRAGQELLCANVLDAALRTLIASKSYKRSDKATKIEATMEGFREKYLSDIWLAHCNEVLKAYHHLRHRNAHPDWLTANGGALSHDEQGKSQANHVV